MTLSNKVAVVTGGSRGIGRAVCLRLAQAGADVAFLYAGNDEKAQETLSQLLAQKVRASAHKCDVSDYEAVTAVFKTILSQYGTVDILVNSAGITADKLMLAMKPADFDRVLDVNLKGTFYTMKQVYSIFAKKRQGKIINIGSVAGVMGNAGQTNYAASKAGVIGLTKSAAKELAARGVCCNVIAPGFIHTDMTEGFSQNQQILEQIPMKRMGTPEEVAELALFLAMPASDYLTGQVICMDGGLAM